MLHVFQVGNARLRPLVMRLNVPDSAALAPHHDRVRRRTPREVPHAPQQITITDASRREEDVITLAQFACGQDLQPENQVTSPSAASS